MRRVSYVACHEAYSVLIVHIPAFLLQIVYRKVQFREGCTFISSTSLRSIRMPRLLQSPPIRLQTLHILQPRLNRRPRLPTRPQPILRNKRHRQLHQRIGRRHRIPHQEFAISLFQLAFQPVEVSVHLARELVLQRFCCVGGRAAAVEDGEGVDEKSPLGGGHPRADLGALDGIAGDEAVRFVVLFAEMSTAFVSTDLGEIHRGEDTQQSPNSQRLSNPHL